MENKDNLAPDLPQRKDYNRTLNNIERLLDQGWKYYIPPAPDSKKHKSDLMSQEMFGKTFNGTTYIFELKRIGSSSTTFEWDVKEIEFFQGEKKTYPPLIICGVNPYMIALEEVARFMLQLEINYMDTVTEENLQTKLTT